MATNVFVQKLYNVNFVPRNKKLYTENKHERDFDWIRLTKSKNEEMYKKNSSSNVRCSYCVMGIIIISYEIKTNLAI